MSTRGAIGWRINGVDKATYNHCDSYPSWLGENILQYVAAHSDEEIAEAAGRIRLVNSDDKPTPDDVRLCRALRTVDLGVGNQSESDWYCLTRGAQGEPEKIADLGLLIDGRNFLGESLFCEWAYIINVDTKKVEAYRGFNKVAARGKIRSDEKKGRYAHLVGDQQVHKDGGKSYRYGGVILLREIPFDDIRRRTIPQLQDLCKDLEEGG